MKKYLVPVLLYFALTFYPPAYSQQKPLFSEDVLVDAFEKGRSLIIVKIRSVNSKEEQNTHFYYYEAEAIQAIIFGDLTPEDIYKPVKLYAGASYGKTLKPYQSPIKNKSIYALFVTKDSPNCFSWAH